MRPGRFTEAQQYSIHVWLNEEPIMTSRQYPLAVARVDWRVNLKCSCSCTQWSLPSPTPPCPQPVFCLWNNFCCSVTQSYPTLFDSMDCSTPGFPVLHHVPEFAQIHVHWVSDTTQPSRPLSSPSPPGFNLSQQGLFPMSWLFALGGQSTRVSASASVLPKNIQN